MMTKWQRLFFLLWPAYEVRWTDQFISPGTVTKEEGRRLAEEEKILRQEILAQNEKNLKAIGDYASELCDSEGARKETLEAKAASIAQSAGIVTAIVSIVPAFSGRQWTSDPEARWFLTIALGLVVLHLFMALRMAIAVRNVRAFYLPSTHEFADLLSEKPADFGGEVATLGLIRAKRNEAALGMKSNRLVAAERYYARGLGFFGAFLVGALLLV